jgi:hypothetical protein
LHVTLDGDVQASNLFSWNEDEPSVTEVSAAVAPDAFYLLCKVQPMTTQQSKQV